MLVAAGADLTRRSEERMVVLEQLVPLFVVGGRTALHYAAEHGSLECAR
jgi:hypothetical protein